MRNTVKKSLPLTVPRRASTANTAVRAMVTRLFTLRRVYALCLGHPALQLEGPLHQTVVGGHLFLQLLDAIGGELVGHQDAAEGARQGADKAHPRHRQGGPVHQSVTSVKYWPTSSWGR